MIKNYVKELSKDTFCYGIAQSLSRFFSVFTAPIMTRIFTPADYGIIDLISTTVAFMILFLALNINGGIFREYYDANDQEKRFLLFSGISAVMMLIFSADLGAIIFAGSISQILFKTDIYANIIRLALLQIPINILFDHFQTLLRFQKRARLFTVISALQMILQLSFLLFYLVYLRMGLPGIYLAAISSTLLPVLILLCLLRRNYSFKINLEYIRRIMAFCLPLMPGLFLNMYLMNANRFFMKAYSSLEQIGIYSIATKIASICSIAALSFSMAWTPFAYGIINKKNKHYLYDKILRIVFGIYTVLIFSASIFANDVLVLLTTEKYFAAYNLVGFIGLGIMMYFINTMLSLGIKISKKTYLMTIAQIAGGITGTFFFFLLIPKFDALGAAIASLIGFSSSSIFIYILSQRAYVIPYRKFNIIVIYVMTLMSIISYYHFTDLSVKISLDLIFLKMLLVFLFSFIILNIALTKEEKMKLMTSLKLRLKTRLSFV